MIGILPGEDPGEANQYVTHVVATGTGHARNLAVVASADAVVAIGGEWGTLAEIAFAGGSGGRWCRWASWKVSGEGAWRAAPESRWPRARPRLFSSPSRSPRTSASLCRPGEVAQLVEHTTENRGVGSSILPLAIPRHPWP